MTESDYEAVLRARNLEQHTDSVRAFVKKRAVSLMSSATAVGAGPSLRSLLDHFASKWPGLLETSPGVLDDLGFDDLFVREMREAVVLSMLLDDVVAGKALLERALHVSPLAFADADVLDANRTLKMDAVTVTLEHQAAFIQFDRPASLNSEDLALIRDLERAVDAAYSSTRAQVIVLRGGPVADPKYAGARVFSSGLNLKELAAGNIPFTDFLMQREVGYVNKLIHGVYEDSCGPRKTKPVMAVVEGHAIGGGAQLVLAADYVVMEEDAFISLPAAQEGILPGLANLRLARFVGQRKAAQMLLTGNRIKATSETGRQLATEIVRPADIESTIESAVGALKASAAAVNKKMLIAASESLVEVRQYLAEFARLQFNAKHSDEVRANLQRWQQ